MPRPKGSKNKVSTTTNSKKVITTTTKKEKVTTTIKIENVVKPKYFSCYTYLSITDIVNAEIYTKKAGWYVLFFDIETNLFYFDMDNEPFENKKDALKKSIENNTKNNIILSIEKLPKIDINKIIKTNENTRNKKV